MPRFSDSIEIARPPKVVWRDRHAGALVLGTSRGLLTVGGLSGIRHAQRPLLSHSKEGGGQCASHPIGGAERAEEDQEGKAFSRHRYYNLMPSPTGGDGSEGE